MCIRDSYVQGPSELPIGPCFVSARLYDETGAAAVPRTTRYVFRDVGDPVGTTGVADAGSASSMVIVTTTAATTYKLQAYLEGTAATGSIATASIHYEKAASWGA